MGEVKSPDGKYVAAAFERDCGATTGYVYHVNLRDEQGRFSPNLEGTIKDGEVLTTGQGKLRMVWKDESTLQIECEGCPHDYSPKAWQRAWKDVSIMYQPTPKPN